MVGAFVDSAGGNITEQAFDIAEIFFAHPCSLGSALQAPSGFLLLVGAPPTVAPQIIRIGLRHVAQRVNRQSCSILSPKMV
jgi:hypothetical protein